MTPHFPTFARRALMKAGAGAAALAAWANVPAIATAVTRTDDADLFAFRAPDGRSLVFALAFPCSGDWQAGAPALDVRIHAGSRIWTAADVRATPSVIPVAGGARMFVGETTRRGHDGAQPHRLVAVSTPADAVQPGSLDVWAEISGRGASRLRIGNPVVAELLARDPSLARIYHRAHPTQDRALFAEALADRIAARGVASGLIDPQVHGERLAAMLLPDVLRFDPARPAGFTFADQNGRRPSDAVGEIVDTILAGVVTPRRSAGGVFAATRAFPYFAVTAAQSSW